MVSGVCDEVVRLSGTACDVEAGMVCELRWDDDLPVECDAFRLELKSEGRRGILNPPRRVF